MTSTDAAPTVHDLHTAVAEASAQGWPMLPEARAKSLLEAAGIPVPRTRTAPTPEGLREVAGELGGPWVVKVVSPSVVHKSDLGGVAVGLADPEAVARAAADMHRRYTDHGYDVSFLVEEMAQPGVEVVVGASRRSGIGWVVMLGLGGVLVEVLDDVAFGLAPLRREDVEGMLAQLRGAALLHGVRGREAVDVAGLVDLVLALAGPGGLLEGAPEGLREVDLNPVVVTAAGCRAVDARLVVGGEEPPPRTGPQAVPAGPGPLPATDLRALFEPRSVAVAGASAKRSNGANVFLRNLRSFGFPGAVHVLHPTATEIEGVPAVPDLAALGACVDYLYVAVPAPAVQDLLEANAGRVAVAQVVSSGFGETADGAQRERDLVAAAHRAGVRLLGPNCIGTHATRGRLTFVDDVEATPGGVAVVSQSGGLGIDVLRVGTARGIRFHSMVSLGNGADLGPAELVRHHLDDDDVDVIGLYLESLAEARAVMDVVRAAPRRKPVVLLAGGQTSSGARAATSHTGSLLGDHRLWPVLADQAGAALVDSLHSLVDTLLALQQPAPPATGGSVDVVLFGNGGGASVLASDVIARSPLELAKLPSEVLAALEDVGLPAGTSLLNPIDAPAPAIAARGGAAAEAVVRVILTAATPPAVLLCHLNVGVVADQGEQDHDVVATIVDALGRARSEARSTRVALVLRDDGRPAIGEWIRHLRRRALDHGLAVFDEIAPAVDAMSAVVTLDRRGTEKGRHL